MWCSIQMTHHSVSLCILERSALTYFVVLIGLFWHYMGLAKPDCDIFVFPLFSHCKSIVYPPFFAFHKDNMILMNDSIVLSNILFMRTSSFV